MLNSKDEYYPATWDNYRNREKMQMLFYIWRPSENYISL